MRQKVRDKKVAILRILGPLSEPISLPDLMKLMIDGSFKERTVRRLLNELEKTGKIKKIGKKKGTKYQIVLGVLPLEQRNLTVNSCFSSESIEAIRYVEKPLYERAPVAYAKEWLDSYVPNKTFLLNEPLRKQLYKAGIRKINHDPAGTYARQIFDRLLIDLSYNSSRLEGNTYTKLDTELLIKKGAVAVGKLDEEKVMILNHKEAIRYLVENAPKLIINEQTIFTLHYLLSDGLIDTAYSGKIRENSVKISGSTY